MRWLAGCGLASVIALSVGALRTDEARSGMTAKPDTVNTPEARSTTIRLLAVGDINLGRRVGQRIHRGDTLYPFVAVKDSFAAFDVVFGNLESQLSNQKGLTENPRNNLIFTGPPAGAYSLKKAGVTIVSTANNHALDYGVQAARETRQNLDEAGVLHVGTAEDTAGLFTPAVLTMNGIRIAFFACTDVMNFEDVIWKKHVAEADTGKLLPHIRAARGSVDFIIVSYHGGEEYADRPTRRTKDLARELLAGGADLFLGHHPHVPYGVEEFEGKYIVHSLGNFVFYQPDRFWAQRSFAFAADITKDETGTRVTSFRCLPVQSGFQPAFVTDELEIDVIMERIRSLSTQSIAEAISY